MLLLRIISATLGSEQEKENTLVRSFEAVKRTAENKPYRPSYGTKGNPVEFRTNYFQVKLPPNLDLHRYRITIDPVYNKEGKRLPEPKGRKLKQVIKIMLKSLNTASSKISIATDFKSTLICSQMIPQNLRDRKIGYYHENDGAAGRDAVNYTVRLEETPPPLRISALVEFLASKNTLEQFEDRESLLQALNIILGHHSKSNTEITMIGGNRAFTRAEDKKTEMSELAVGIQAIRGYFLSVRIASFRTLVNVNVSHAAFYEVKSLPALITKWGGNLNTMNEAKWRRLETFLRGVKVNTHYLKDENHIHITQVRSIKGFASQSDGGANGPPPYVEIFAAPPQQVWFHLDDKRDFTKQKYKCEDNNGRVMDKYISVAEFFESSMPPFSLGLHILLNCFRTWREIRCERSLSSCQPRLKGKS